MDNFQLAILVMSVVDVEGGSSDTDGRRRQLTAEQLDALADFGWHWPDLRGFLATWANTVRSFGRPRASSRLDPMPLPAAE